jgi:hypothetical protein
LQPSSLELDTSIDPEPAPRPKRPLLLWIGALAFLSILAVAGFELVTYCVTYPRTRLHPEAGTEGPLRAYYLDWRKDWIDLDDLRRAAREGVMETPRALREDGRLIPDPIGVIQGGLALHDQLLDDPSQSERAEILRNQLDWLAASAIWLADSIPVWPCYWDAGEYGLEGPWISAMTQGQAISLLTRGADYFEDDAYLRLAERAVASLRDPSLPITRRTAEGEVLFEEFPSEPPSLVLNGALCTWLGLWDYWRATGDAEVREFAMECLEAMDRRIGDYELGDWTRYDLIKTRPVSPTYQEIHATLAEAIYSITGEPSWRDRALRWRGVAERPEVRFRIFFQVLGAKIERYWKATRVEPLPMPAGLSGPFPA